jgi:hypothetical protein
MSYIADATKKPADLVSRAWVRLGKEKSPLTIFGKRARLFREFSLDHPLTVSGGLEYTF